MGEIKLFEKKEFGAVRIVIRNGNPWFGAKDVATALGYADTDDAVRRHCNYAELFKPGELPGLEIGPRGMYFIPEPDVYRLVVRSNLPRAVEFQDWICEEVIPSIRKTGAYATNNALTMPNFSNPAEAARAWADEYEAKQRSALILLKRMRKPPFLDRFGGFALSRGCPDPELIAVSAGSFNEANVLEPHRR